MLNRIKLLGMILVLVFIQTGCGGIGNKPKTYRQGDSVQIDRNVILTLVSWDVLGNDLQAVFSVQNKGTETFVMHGTFLILKQNKAVRDFSALAPVALSGPANTCSSTLYGNVLPGTKMEGTVCWKDVGGMD